MMKTNCIKTVIFLGIINIMVGCKHGRISDVSMEPPHNALVNSVWRLKTDAYIIEYQDNRGTYLLIPCSQKLNSYNFPDFDWKYDEAKVGRKFDGKKVKGGLRVGETLRVVRVLKVDHVKLGTSYVPALIPEQSNQWTGDKELNGNKLYRNFYDKGVLNPAYAEMVSTDTNTSLSVAEGFVGSEEIND